MYACVHSSLDRRSGSYLQDCGVTKVPGRNVGHPQLWNRVWEMTQDWVDGAELDSYQVSLNPATQIYDVFWARFVDPVLNYLGLSRKADVSEQDAKKV